jgi:hypothetical protein
VSQGDIRLLGLRAKLATMSMQVVIKGTVLCYFELSLTIIVAVVIRIMVRAATIKDFNRKHPITAKRE